MKPERNFSSLVTQSTVTGRKVQYETFHLLTKMPGQTVRARLRLEDFNAILATFIGEAIATVQTALGSAGLLPEEIDCYFVVGGGSRIPMLSTELERLFGKPSEALVGEFGTIDINYAVGRGAAIYDLDRSNDSEVEIERLLPYPISTITDDRTKSVCLFEEGTRLPAESTRELFAELGFKDVQIDLFRGIGNPTDGVQLQSGRIRLPEAPAPGANAIEFRCHLSKDGELTLTVVDWKNRELEAVRFDGLGS